MSDINLTEFEISSIVKEVLSITKDIKKTTLSAAEAANLWNQYMGDSSAICFNTYYHHITEDKEIQSILEHAIQLSKNHLNKVAEFFNQANFPQPTGFSIDQDVNLKAPRVCSDDFIVYYLEVMAIYGVTTYSLAVSSCGRDDIRNYFIECSTQATDLLNKVISLSKSRGQYSDAPMIPPHEHVEFMEKKGLISDFFGSPKPLNATEITNLWFNLKKSILATAAALGFSQIAESEEVRHFFTKVAENGEKHLRDLGEILHKDNLPSPRTWDSDLTTSTISTFSDRLMMFHMGFKLSAAIAYYGSGMATSTRADVIASYSKIIMDVIKEANEWLSLMVKNEWLEKQPEAADRKSLAQR